MCVSVYLTWSWNTVPHCNSREIHCSLIPFRFHIRLVLYPSKQKKKDIWHTLRQETSDFWLWTRGWMWRLSVLLWHVDQRIHLKPSDLSHVGNFPPLPLMTRAAPEDRQGNEPFGLVCVSDIIVNKWKLFYRTPPRQRLAAGWDFTCGIGEQGGMNVTVLIKKKGGGGERDGEIGKRD